MIPRGEVGLIFATIGLSQAIIGQRDYASILLVVLLTTLATPPVLRARLERMRKGAMTPAGPQAPRPEGGWLALSDGRGGIGVVDLVAIPPIGEALDVGMQAALMLDEQHRPGERLVDWLSQLPTTPLRFDRGARQTFFALLEQGALGRGASSRSPGCSIARSPSSARRSPVGSPRRSTSIRSVRCIGPRSMQRTASSPTAPRGSPPLAHPEWVELAALVLDASGGSHPPVLLARRVMQRLDLGAAPGQAVAALVGDVGLLQARALRPDALAEETVLQLAAHLGTPEQARGLAVLTLAAEEPDGVERARIDALLELIEAALAHPELTSRSASNTVEQRRNEAARLAADPRVKQRLAVAPRAYVLAQTPEALARQAALCEPAVPVRRSSRCRPEVRVSGG